MAKFSDDSRRYQARQEPVRCRHAGHQGRVQQGRQAVPSGWLEEQNEKLQSQNKALLSEVELLKARVQQLENKRSAEEACLPEH